MSNSATAINKKLTPFVTKLMENSKLSWIKTSRNFVRIGILGSTYEAYVSVDENTMKAVVLGYKDLNSGIKVDTKPNGNFLVHNVDVDDMDWAMEMDKTLSDCYIS